MEEILEDILIEIFSHLQNIPLQNAKQVCKRWREIITTTSTLQSKIILEIFINNTVEAIEKSKSFPYKSIYLTMEKVPENNEINSAAQITVSQFDAHVKEIFTTLGNDLKVLKIKNFDRLLPMLLLMTPNIINLSLYNVDVNNRQLRIYPIEDFDNIYQPILGAGPSRAHRDPMRFADHLNPFWDHQVHEFEQQQILMQGFLNRYGMNINPDHPGHADHVHPQPNIHHRLRRRALIRLRHGQDENQRQKSQLLKSYPNVPIVRLKHLKFLEIKEVKKVLCWIEAINLQTFIIHDALNCDGIEELLKTTGKLENLIIDQFVTSFFKNPEKFTFQLKKLQIGCINEAQVLDENEKFVFNFIKFLKSQKYSLKDLTMTFQTVHPDVIVILNFLNNYLNLSNFSINFKLENSIDLSSIRTNSVDSIMSGYLSIFNDFKNLISSCENVTSLELNFDMYIEIEVLNHLALSMPNLKNLSIHPFFTKVSSLTVFDKLESLKITKLREGPHTATWYEIAMTCPNIKELSLVDEVFEISPMKLKMVMENSTNLKILNFTGLFRSNICDEFLRIFLDENIKIWRITVNAKMEQEEFYEKMKILTENSNIQTVLHKIQ